MQIAEPTSRVVGSERLPSPRDLRLRSPNDSCYQLLVPLRLKLEPSEALISCRGALHLAYRLSSRATVLLLAGTTSHSLRLRGVAVIFIGLDVLSWSLLRRTSRFLLVPRLVIDVLDAALWSVLLPTQTTNPVLVGVPLALETGTRWSLGGIIVPIVTFGGMLAARTAAGYSLSPAAVIFQLTAVWAGIGMAAYERSYYAATRSDHENVLAARLKQAYAAGQASITFGADTIVDMLTSVGPLLGTPDSPPLASDAVAAWRQGLAADVGASAEFLGTTVRRWERLRADHPDISSWVNVSVPEGDGTVLLSPSQAQWLHGALEASDFEGHVRVEVLDRRQAELPGRPRTLSVNGRQFVVPADASTVVPFDAGPILFMIGAAWALGSMSPDADAMPWPIAIGAAALCLAAAARTHYAIRRLGTAADRSTVLLAFLVVAAYSVAATVALRDPHTVFTFGQTTYAATGALLALPIMIACFYWPDLDRRTRLLLPGGLGILSAGGVFFGSAPFHARDYALALVNLPPPIIAAATLVAAARRAATELADQLARRDEPLAATQFRSGQRSVYELVETAAHDGRTRHRALEGRMPTGQWTEIHRRLVAIERRLQSLQWSLGSPSSMTTSSAAEDSPPY